MLIRTKARSYENNKKELVDVVFNLHDIKRIESKKIAKKYYTVIIFDDNECIEVMILFETLAKLWRNIQVSETKEIIE